MNKLLLIVLLLSGCAVTQQELDPVKTAAAIGQAAFRNPNLPANPVQIIRICNPAYILNKIL